MIESCFFITNHFAHIEVGAERLRYFVDMAEISAFQELQMIDADEDGGTSSAGLDE
ncbi:MAG: hypothetical protein M3430_14335 [Acidobacteriota bacterium]|nr:hypothetical protein [Acidobacteriota bacterium]